MGAAQQRALPSPPISSAIACQAVERIGEVVAGQHVGGGVACPAMRQNPAASGARHRAERMGDKRPHGVDAAACPRRLVDRDARTDDVDVVAAESPDVGGTGFASDRSHWRVSAGPVIAANRSGPGSSTSQDTRRRGESKETDDRPYRCRRRRWPAGHGIGGAVDDVCRRRTRRIVSASGPPVSTSLPVPPISTSLRMPPKRRIVAGAAIEPVAPSPAATPGSSR